MTLHLTRRRNGRYMATVRIRFDADRETAIHALAFHRDVELYDDVDPKATKRMVEEALRHGYLNRGDELGTFLSDAIADNDSGNELIEWATSEVERLFPEWREHLD